MRLYNKLGSPLTGPVHIDGTGSVDHDPTIAMNASGQEIAVAWDHLYGSGDRDIYVQRFDNAGHAWGGLVPVALSIKDEYEPSMGMAPPTLTHDALSPVPARNVRRPR